MTEKVQETNPFYEKSKKGVLFIAETVIFFPVKGILYLLPGYQPNYQPKLFFLQYIFYTVVQVIMNYILFACVHNFCEEAKISQNVGGVLFLAFIF